MTSKGFSIKEAILFGWEQMKKNFMFFLALLLIFFAIEVIADWFFVTPNFNLTTQIGMTAVILILLFVKLAFTKISLDAANKKELTLDINEISSKYLNFLLVHILTAIAVSVGFALLIIPGIILTLQFSMAPYLVIEKDMSPIEAMRESSRITKGQKWHLFLFYLMLVLINIAGILVFVVGVFSTLPTSMIAHASVYNKLKK